MLSKNPLIFFFSCCLLFTAFSCKENSTFGKQHPTTQAQENPVKLRTADARGNKIAEAALSLTKDDVTYDPAYFVIDYPNGDVPKGKGVCTDVVIRTFRKTGIDLQKEVHEDMQAHFNQYPTIWGKTETDKNIDHRRVPNLMMFFSRKGISKSITQNGADYLPGDIVAWRLASGQTHIGIVSNVMSRDKLRYQMVHNIGGGQVLEDCLFDYRIIGHYQYPK